MRPFYWTRATSCDDKVKKCLMLEWTVCPPRVACAVRSALLAKWRGHDIHIEKRERQRNNWNIQQNSFYLNKYTKSPKMSNRLQQQRSGVVRCWGEVKLLNKLKSNYILYIEPLFDPITHVSILLMPRYQLRFSFIFVSMAPAAAVVLFSMAFRCDAFPFNL